MVINSSLHRFLSQKIHKHFGKDSPKCNGLSIAYFLPILLILFLLSVPSLANTNTQHLNFEHISVEDGLPSSTVYTAFQDSKGYMWFGTEAGLSRYDGYTFTNYTITDNLPANDIFQLIEDTLGRIWMLSLGNLSYYYEDSIYQLQYPEVNNKRIYSLLLNDKNELCFSIKGTIFKLDKDFNIHTTPFLDKSSNQFYGGMWLRIHVPSQTMWITFRDTLYEANRKTPPICLKNTPITGHRKVFNEIITTDSILYGSKKGLMLYKNKTDYELIYTPPDPSFNFENISDLVVDDRNNIWLSNLSNGCVQFSPDLQEVNYYLPDIGVSDIHKDREGNLWVTSLGNGVYKLPWNQHIINNYQQAQGLTDNNIHSLVIDKEEQLWLGTKNGHIIKFAPKGSSNITITHHLQEDYYFRVMGMTTLSDSSLLLGTDKGISIYKDGKFRFSSFFVAVKDMDYDEEHEQIWIACSNSTIKMDFNYLRDSLFNKEQLNFDTENKTHRERVAANEYIDLIHDKRTYAICADESNTAWLGNNKGLHFYNGDSIIHPVSSHKLLNISIAKIRKQKDSPLLWIATHGGGLVIKKGDQVRNINTKTGLASDMCNDVFIVNDSTIWLATNRGVHKITYRDFDQHDYSIKHFDSKDGIASNAIYSVLIKDSNIYLGTTKGLSVFQEPTTNAEIPPPPIYINRLRINAKDTILQDHYQLNYLQNDFIVDFVGLSYKSVKDIEYTYQLEGIDKDWQYTKSTSIRYNSLPAGDYTFKVKAINKDLVSSSQNAQFSISISLPWWRNWWFIMSGLLFLSLLAYIILQALLTARYNQRLKQVVAEKTEQLEDNIKELKRSNEHLQEYAHITSHDLKEPLRSISGFIQLIDYRYKDTVDTEIKEYIGYTITGVKRMEALINALLEYSKVNRKIIQLEEFDTEVVVHQVTKSLHSLINRRKVDIQISQLPTIIGDKQQLGQLFQNLIQNGIKFNKTEHPSIKIDYEEHPNFWSFRVTDNGIGIAEEYQEKIFTLFKRLHNQSDFEGTGTGLTICKRIVERHEGKIWVESEPNQGTTFYFTINKHLKR